MDLMTEEKKEFKKTDLGLIPNDWAVENFTDYCWFQEGPGLRKWQFTKQGMKVINVTNLQEDRTLDLDKTDRHISIEEFENNYQHFEIDQYDIVMASSGNSYCKTSVVQKKDLPLMMNTSVIRFKPRENLDYDYLLSYLTSPYFKDQIDLLITGGAQPNFGPYHLKRINLPIPQSIQEQKAIGKALSNVDELIRSLDGLIQKKQAIKKGAMQQLLTGKKRLPGFDGEWEVKKLGDVTNIIMGSSPSSSNYNTEGNGLPLIGGNADIKNRKTIKRVWTTQITKTCDEGDVIMTVRAPVGTIAISTNEACLGRGVCALKASNLDRSFLYHQMLYSEPKWKVLEQGSTFTSANSNQIEGFELVLPPTKEEQKAIAQILSDMDLELQTLRQKREKYVQIKQGMMQQLLTGRIRIYGMGG